ncbi:MAG: hypothetical protein ACYDBH_01160 [Acidobacteriaceae bacterium]
MSYFIAGVLAGMFGIALPFGAWIWWILATWDRDAPDAVFAERYGAYRLPPEDRA